MCTLFLKYLLWNRVICLDTKNIILHMVSSFLYDYAKSALPGTPLPSNPS